MQQDMMAGQRLQYIDFLKFIGITLIILAHCNAPDWLVQFRSFDVPLMLFASGLAYSGKDPDTKGGRWYWKRLCRLLIPTWSFLALLFIFQALFPASNVCGGDVWPMRIISTFIMLPPPFSIGYTWIIKVFILIMLVTPLMLRFSARASAGRSVAAIIALLVLNELAVTGISRLPIGKIRMAFTETIPYLLAYSAAFLAGTSVRKHPGTVKPLSLVFLLLLALPIMLQFMDGGGLLKLSPDNKYPPRLVFLAYGLLCSVCLWWAKDALQTHTDTPFINFIGQNTLWIYLWHIPFLGATRLFSENWAVVFALSFVAATSITYLQSLLARKLPEGMGKYLAG